MSQQNISLLKNIYKNKFCGYIINFIYCCRYGIADLEDFRWHWGIFISSPPINFDICKN